MILPPTGEVSVEALQTYNADWLVAASLFHAALSLAFGLIYGLLLLRLPPIPGPFAWGALLMPLLWTATSYALMGVVNPILQQLVDWPWFVVSQFVFGLVVAIVVVQSEQVYVAPAGPGPDAGHSKGTQ
jgi:small basic protein